MWLLPFFVASQGMTMNTSQAMGRFASGRAGWLLAGMMLFGGSGSTVVVAQEVITAGNKYSCAVVYGQLQCWGQNHSGQLGNGTTTASTMPTRVVALDGTITVAAASSGAHTCAIVDEGLACWGYNNNGQLGNGTTTTSTTPVPVPGLDSDVAAVAVGAYHTCAVVGGGLKCWGFNGSGQLGTGNTISSAIPVTVPLFPPGSGVTAVAAGLYYTCAVVNNGVWCWGANNAGQLGNGTTAESSTPVAVSGPINNAVGVAAGYVHSCAMLDNGEVRCWGYNGTGQLGDNTFDQSTIPVTVYRIPSLLIPLSGATAITAGGYHTCATTTGDAYCWGYNETGQLGVGSTEDFAFAQPVNSPGADMTAIAAGGTHTCAVASDEVLCWGSDEFGQLGDAAASPYVPAPVVSITGFADVAAGRLHGCATSDSGTGAAYCWGSNSSGQLGSGTFADSASPHAVSDLGPGSGVVAVAPGGSHSCAQLDSGGVRCWGDNESGQLGNNSLAQSSTPVAVIGLDDATSLTAGTSHACAARSGGGVRCWGANDYGQVGNGTPDSSPVPVDVLLGNPSPTPVPLSGATSVAAGYRHTCAVANGGAFCWGRNHVGQLGNDSTTDSPWAVQVAGLGAGSAVTAVSVGDAHTCAMVDEGVQCWGYNSNGQLGNGTDDESTTPVPVTGLDSGVSAVASGNTHTCAVVDGGVQCWGYNSYGQLGDGSFLRSNVPVKAIPPDSSITKVTAGENYTCATGAPDGESTTWCWGNGMYGRLANDELGYESLPVRVLDSIFAHGFD